MALLNSTFIFLRAHALIHIAAAYSRSALEKMKWMILSPGFQNIDALIVVLLLIVSMSSSQSQSTQASASSSSHHISPQKRPATARMHVSPRKKPRTDDVPQLPLPTALDQTPPGTVNANTGECPPYNDHAAWIEDTTKNTVYAFGGTRPGDEDCIPTSDFFKCDAKTMHWENLTVKSFSQLNVIFLRFDLLYSRMNYGFGTLQTLSLVQNFFERRKVSQN